MNTKRLSVLGLIVGIASLIIAIMQIVDTLPIINMVKVLVIGQAIILLAILYTLIPNDAKTAD